MLVTTAATADKKVDGTEKRSVSLSREEGRRRNERDSSYSK